MDPLKVEAWGFNAFGAIVGCVFGLSGVYGWYAGITLGNDLMPSSYGIIALIQMIYFMVIGIMLQKMRKSAPLAAGDNTAGGNRM